MVTSSAWIIDGSPFLAPFHCLLEIKTSRKMLSSASQQYHSTFWIFAQFFQTLFQVAAEQLENVLKEPFRQRKSLRRISLRLTHTHCSRINELNFSGRLNSTCVTNGEACFTANVLNVVPLIVRTTPN